MIALLNTCFIHLITLKNIDLNSLKYWTNLKLDQKEAHYKKLSNTLSDSDLYWLEKIKWDPLARGPFLGKILISGRNSVEEKIQKEPVFEESLF